MVDPRTDLPQLPDVEAHHDHRDISGGWLRPTVFGTMDGLVSNFALIAGVAGGDVRTHAIALTGLAGLVAGACSMAAGEYVSVQSQNEAAHAELQVEARELRRNPEAELAELTEMYIARGVDPDTAAKVARQLSVDPDQALLIHAQEELGVDPHGLPSPWTAALSSLASFSVGAIIPVLPYLLGATNLLVSALLSVLALFVAGVLTSRFTSRSWWFSGLRQLLLGVVAAAITFGVGALFHAGVS